MKDYLSFNVLKNFEVNHFKSLLNFLQYCLLLKKKIMFLVFWLWGTWDPSSPTKDWTHTLCIRRRSLKHWTSREIPWKITFIPQAEGVSMTQRTAFYKHISQLQRRDLQSCRNAQRLPSWVFFPPSAQRLYKAAGEDARHQYTMTLGLPEFVRAKANAANLSDVSLSHCWGWDDLQGQVSVCDGT